MHKLYDIKEALMRELEDYAGRDLKTAGTVQCVHVLTDTIKNIDKIVALEGSSHRMSGYSGEHSGYARRYSERSYDAAKDRMMDRMSGLMNEAAPHERDILEKAMRQLRTI